MAPIFVNVASSALVLDGFVNLDNYLPLVLPRALSALIHRLFPSPERRASFDQFHDLKKAGKIQYHDCRRPLPFDDDCVDHIFCSHFLEHLFPDQAEAVLQDYFRTLRPGGTLHLIVPDTKALAAAYLESHSPHALDTFLDAMLLSHRTQPGLGYRLREVILGHGLQHHWMYDQASMEARLRRQGFILLPENRSPSALVHADGRCQVNLLAQKP